MKKVIFIIIYILIFASGIAQGMQGMNEGLLLENTIIVDNNIFNISQLYDIQKIIEDLSYNKKLPESLRDYRVNNDLGLNYSQRYKFIYLIPDTDYRMGYVFYKQRELTAAKDTVKFLLNQYKSKTYNLKYYNLEQSLEGIYIFRELNSFLFDKLNMAFAVKYLMGRELKEAHYNGFIEFEDDKPYMTAFSDGIDSNLNNISSILDKAFYSYGYSLDVLVEKRFNDNIYVLFRGEDLLSQIYWKNIFSYTKEYSNSGMGLYKSKKPSYVRGNFFYGDYITVLRPSYELQVVYRNIQLGIRYKYHMLPYIGYNFAENRAKFEVGGYQDRYMVKFYYRGLSLNLSIDNKVKYLKAGLQFSLKF